MGTFIVAGLLLVIVILVIVFMIKRRRSGKSGCGYSCGCGGCPVSDSCSIKKVENPQNMR
jgi:hypothetical protein